MAEYIALAAPLRCDRAVRCGEIGASEREQCVLEVPRKLDLYGVTRGVQTGRYRFDPALAGRCLQHLRDAPCGFDRLLFDCLDGAVPPGLRGTVAPGGPCERDEECDNGICTGDRGCPGVCRTRGREGETCSHSHQCGDHLFCDRGVCRPQGELGSACRGDWRDCRPGLVCQDYVPANHDPDAERPEQPGVCEAPRGPGQACRGLALANACAAGTFCDFAAATPTCRARLPRDAACTWPSACADHLRCDGILLSDDVSANGSGMRALVRPGVCRPVGDSDSRCDPTATQTLCPVSMACSDAGACVPHGGTGAVCRNFDDCSVLHVCDLVTRTCQPKLMLGEPCAAGSADHCADRCDPQTLRCVGACRGDI